MNVKGIRGMSIPEIQEEVYAGGRFVQFSFCISLIVVSFRQSSAVYFIRKGESTFIKGLPFSFISLLVGWWGIPWAPIYTLCVLYTNTGGGKDLTVQMMKILHSYTNGHVFDFEKMKHAASVINNPSKN